jgi:hypothetical protein
MVVGTVAGGLCGAVESQLMQQVNDDDSDNTPSAQAIMVTSRGGGGGGGWPRVIRITSPRNSSSSNNNSVTHADRMVLEMFRRDLMAQHVANADRMTYEQLLQHLGTGDVEGNRRGLTQQVIGSLPTETVVMENKNHEEQKDDNDDNNTSCCICLEEYCDGDVVRKLPACPHGFHRDCIDQWLRQVASCPVCKREVVSPTH